MLRPATPVAAKERKLLLGIVVQAMLMHGSLVVMRLTMITTRLAPLQRSCSQLLSPEVRVALLPLPLGTGKL